MDNASFKSCLPWALHNKWVLHIKWAISHIKCRSASVLRSLEQYVVAAKLGNELKQPGLLRRLEAMGLPVAEHDAYTTIWTRKKLGVPKTHVNDALCIGTPDALAYLPAIKSVVRSVGHGDRQMLRPADLHGNPRGRGYRECCALPRRRQGYTTCPGHRSRRKQLKGLASGDLVQFRHHRHGLVRGYAALTGGRVAVAHVGKPVSMRAQDAVLLARNHGYRVSIEANA